MNRSRVKKRHEVPLTAEMLNELNKNHLAGVDNYAMDGLYDMDAIWNEKIQDRRSMKVRTLSKQERLFCLKMNTQLMVKRGN